MVSAEIKPDLLFYLFDSLDYLFNSEIIKMIGFVHHPTFKASEKQ
ncbi:hypothetical protein [Flavobacterium sp.]|nr:hypothetical protein [Flavobacterium sp.]